MKHLFTLLSLLTISSLASAQAEQRIKQYNLASTSLAISGYDPVAYFTQRKAVEGLKAHTLVHDGVTYRFASQQNKALFQKNPSAYEPQYGGWCAYAMGAKGEKVDIDPETFKLIDGKLYLFYNKYFNNTLKSWNKDEAALKSKADINWKKLFN